MRIAATFSSCSLDRPMSRPAPSPANQTRSKASHDARAAFFRSLTTSRSRASMPPFAALTSIARRQDAREEDARGGQGPKLGDAALERDEIVRQIDDRFLELLHLLGRARDGRRDLLDLLPSRRRRPPPALSKATRLVPPTPPRTSSVANRLERKGARPGRSSAEAPSRSSRLRMAAVSACSFRASAFNRSNDWFAATYFGSACGLPSFFLAHAWIDMAPEVRSNDKITTFERDTRENTVLDGGHAVTQVSCPAPTPGRRSARFRIVAQRR